MQLFEKSKVSNHDDLVDNQACSLLQYIDGISQSFFILVSYAKKLLMPTILFNLYTKLP